MALDETAATVELLLEGGGAVEYRLVSCIAPPRLLRRERPRRPAPAEVGIADWSPPSRAELLPPRTRAVKRRRSRHRPAVAAASAVRLADSWARGEMPIEDSPPRPAEAAEAAEPAEAEGGDGAPPPSRGAAADTAAAGVAPPAASDDAAASAPAARRSSRRRAARPLGQARGGAQQRPSSEKEGSGSAVESFLQRSALQEAVQPLLAAPPAALASTYSRLSPHAKLALLGLLVNAAAETAAAAAAAEAQQRRWQELDVEGRDARRGRRRVREAVRAAVEEHFELKPRGKRKGQGGRAEGGRAEAEGDALVQRAKSVVARLAAAGVLGPPALVVSRAELTASEVAQVRSR